jgi:hypothetical protein
MTEKRPVADPALIAAIQARRRAVAAGAPVSRRFTVRATTPRYPAPPAPTPPTPTPPTPDPAPPDPTPDTDDTPSSMFSAANATAIYEARAQVLRRIGVSRVGAMDHTGAGNEVTSRQAPTRSAPPAWPNPDVVYAARRRDVERARARRRE